MVTTKTVTVLDNNVTLVAAAANHTSGLWDLQDGYGGLLSLKITNGATGPTLAAQCQIQTSGDGTNWYTFATWGAQVGSNIVSSIVMMVPIGAKYLQVISGSNTGQDVVLRVTGIEVSEIS